MKFKIGKTYKNERKSKGKFFDDGFILKLFEIDRDNNRLIFEGGRFLWFDEIKEGKFKLTEIKNADEIEI